MSLFILINQDIDTSFFTLEMTWKGMNDSRVAEHIGRQIPSMFEEMIEGSTINTFMEQEPFADFINACADALFNRPELLAELKKQTLSVTSEIRAYATEMLDRIETLSDEELARFIEKARTLQGDAVAFGSVVAFADVFGSVTDRMQKILQSRTDLRHPFHVYGQVLSTPQEKSLTEQAVDDICTSSTSSPELAKKYFWLHQGYIGRGCTAKEIDDIRSHGLRASTSLPPRDEVFEELNFTEEEAHVFSAARDVVIIKALRADTRQFLHVVLNRIIDRLALRWNLSSKHLEALSGPEIVTHLRNGSIPDSDALQARFSHSVLVPNDRGSYDLLLDVEASAYTKTHLYRETIEHRSEVKGQIAHPGKVTGKVRLIFGPQHNNKMCDGDILVSVATSPQLLPAMKRAAAFVTDVGGITSHAAIVARELGKPCIVGTKHATEIFSDGDEVEVDAEKGIVRKA